MTTGSKQPSFPGASGRLACRRGEPNNGWWQWQMTLCIGLQKRTHWFMLPWYCPWNDLVTWVCRG